MMKKTLLFISIFIICTSAIPAFSDNIRGNVVQNVVLSDSSRNGDNVFPMSLEEVFSVSFDRNAKLIRGVEIEIKIPSLLRSYSSSIAFELYKQISPSVATGVGTYYGKKYQTVFTPDATKFYIQIPYGSSLENESAPYTKTINESINYNDSPLMVTVNPMMKGFPSSLYKTDFTVSVYPLLKESGNLQLDIHVDKTLDKQNLRVSIDGKPMAFTGQSTTFSLSAGRHSVNAELEGGLSINKEFSITAGKTTPLTLELTALESFLTVDVPEGTEIFLDGEKVEMAPGNVIKADPGEHSILFMIGDYKISKRFTVSPGKDCKISLFLDILIEEN